MEQPVPRRTLLAGRIRRQGLVAVLSQIAFVALVRPLLERGSQAAVEAHCRDFALDRADIGAGAIISVPSVNSQQCRETLRALSPKLVVVNGTRIISHDTLAAPGAQFVNIHAGITPRYRGVHGGYWALWNGEPQHCGVTVHLVDAGVDTGDVLGQAPISPGPGDNFASYPFLQLAAALPILFDCVERGLQGPLQGRPAEGPSSLWYHPGLGQYLAGRTRGVY